MWFGRKRLDCCLGKWAKSTVTQSAVAPLRFISTSSATVTSSAAVAPVDLSYTCRLLDSICSAQQSIPIKRKRVRGAVQRMESSVVDSFAAATVSLRTSQKRDMMYQWLRSLAAAVNYLPRQEASLDASQGIEADRFSQRLSRRARHDTHESENWSGASPYFSLPTSDLLCLCLRECAMASPTADPEVLHNLLLCAVKLELGEVEVLKHIVHVLTTTELCRRRTPSEQVELLNIVSLAVKRCKLPLPPLDRVLCVVLGATLSARENLVVLSSIHRLQHMHTVETVAAVSRKAAEQTAEYNIKDVVYGLEVAALLPGCNEVFVAGVLLRAGELAPNMSPKHLGAVCKYVSLLNPSRKQNTFSYSCGRELRALLPLLVERTEQLLGHFRLQEARYVLRCFREHRVRHSLIFSRLTPIAGDA
ncbi:hypothetical protein, conserved [Leishmania tarentolae]|uniref:Uncharacterized protein n=1 Tax=Leishmania tarentolae TaxID=5689 RepID=A0A640KTL9_LEITA|nr:hypothetical protein, conserved [Leishmania tarentolae]